MRAAPMRSGVAPNAFDTRMRTRLPPMLVWTIRRRVWSVKVCRFAAGGGPAGARAPGTGPALARPGLGAGRVAGQGEGDRHDAAQQHAAPRTVGRVGREGSSAIGEACMVGRTRSDRVRR